MSTVSATIAARPLSLEQLAALSDEIGALAKAGVPLDRGLQALARDMPGRIGAVAGQMSQQMTAGRPLGQVIADLGHTLPEVYRPIIVAGLRSGRLPVALEGISRTARRISELRRSIGLSLLYPLVVLSLTWFLGLFVLIQIAPVMFEMLIEFDVTTVPVQAALDRLVQSAPYWGALVPLSFAAYLGWVWYRSGQAAAGVDLHPVLAFGALGTLARMQRASRCATLAELLALLLSNDVPLAEAVELASAAVGSRGIAAGGKKLAECLTRGEPIGQTPEGFPALLAWMLAAGHSQAQLCKSLFRTAEVYRDEVTRSSQWLAFYTPLILTVVVTGGVVFCYTLLTLGPWIALMRRLTAPVVHFF